VKVHAKLGTCFEGQHLATVLVIASPDVF